MVGDIDRSAAGSRSQDCPQLRETEVEHLDGAIGLQLDVGRLEIAMNDAVLVSGFECLRNLPRDRQCFFEGIAPCAIRSASVGPSTSSMHERASAAPPIFEAVDLRDVGMIECRQQLRFALESRQPIGIAANASAES